MSAARTGLAAALASLALAVSAAPADSPATESGGLPDSGKLPLTGGVTNIEGASGGGLAAWATITGDDGSSGVGANMRET